MGMLRTAAFVLAAACVLAGTLAAQDASRPPETRPAGQALMGSGEIRGTG